MCQSDVCRILLVLLLAMVPIGGLQASEPPREPVGIILSLKGSATIIGPDGVKREAQLTSKVYVGDRVETGSNSFVQLHFLDSSKISLAGSSDVTIENYIFNRENDQARSDLRVENGALRFMAGKIAKIAPQNYRIMTVTASVGIRGSSGELQVSDGSLPGIPAGLQVMKTGGLGITTQLNGATEMLPDISEEGRGYVITEGGTIQAAKFSGSIVDHYAHHNEKQFAKARAKVAPKPKVKPTHPRAGKTPKETGVSLANATMGAEKGATKSQLTAEDPVDKQTADLEPVAMTSIATIVGKVVNNELPDEVVLVYSDEVQEEIDRGQTDIEDYDVNEVVAVSVELENRIQDEQDLSIARASATTSAQNARQAADLAAATATNVSSELSAATAARIAASAAAANAAQKATEAAAASASIGTPEAAAAATSAANEAAAAAAEEALAIAAEAEVSILVATASSKAAAAEASAQEAEAAEALAQSASTPSEAFIHATTALTAEANAITNASDTQVSLLSAVTESDEAEAHSALAEAAYVNSVTHHYTAHQLADQAGSGIVMRNDSGLISGGEDIVKEENLLDATLTLSEDGSGHDHEMSVPAFPDPMTDVYLREQGSEHERLVDAVEEFAIVNLLDDTAGSEEFTLFAYGKESTSPDVPGSGNFYYSSDLNQDGTALDSNADQLVASVLLQNDQVANPGFSTDAVIDFTAGRMLGRTFSVKKESQLPGMEQTLSDTIFFGDVDASGTLSNIKLYRNMGFSGSHVELPGALSLSSIGYDYSDFSLDDMTGTGQLYGSSTQGYGITAQGSTTEFFASGAQVVSPDVETSNNGTYVGFTVGYEVTGAGGSSVSKIPTTFLSITPDFTANTLSVNVDMDSSAHILTQGSEVFAADREHLFSSLVASSGITLVPDQSFLATLPLPTVIGTGGSSIKPEDTMWGTMNIVESGSPHNTIYPGLHNIWVAGKPTPTTTGTFAYQKLAAPNAVEVYRGTVLHTLSDPINAENTHELLSLSPDWVIGDFADGAHGQGVDPSIASGNGPILSTSGGYMALRMDMGSEEEGRGIVFLEHEVVIFEPWPSGLSENGFLTFADAYSLAGQNGGASDYYSPGTGGFGVMGGGFAGDNASSLYLGYARSDPAANGMRGAGAGLAVQAGAAITSDNVYFEHYGHGLWIDESGATPIATVLTNPDIEITLQADQDVFDTGASSLSIDGGSEVIGFSADLSTFIEKNAFFSKMADPGASRTFASNIGAKNLDPENMYVLGMPGLEGFDYITWGIWGAKEAGSTSHLQGFFGGGQTDLDGTLTQVPDYATIAGQANPVIRYSGPAMGVLFESGHGQQRFGTTTLDVNFNSGGVTGAIDLGANAMVNVAGTVDQASHSFAGSATLNGGGAGSFKGGFYADEAAGSFGASNGARQISGAFGGKAEVAIPLTAP